MRILLLAQWYEPIIGGEETHVRALAQTLAALGHEVAVATLSHRARPALSLDGGVRIYRIEAAIQRLPALFTTEARQSAPPVPDPLLARGLRRVLRRERPDIVHAHNWIVYSYLPVQDWSVPLIMTLHDHSQVCAKKNMMYRDQPCSGPGPLKCLGCAARHYGLAKGTVTLAGLWGARPALRRAVSCFVSVSEAVAVGNGLAEDNARHEVIPNFIPDADAVASPPRGADVAAVANLPQRPFFLFVGSLSRIKGISQLLEAYRQLPPHRPPLVLIGYRGSERLPELEQLPAGAHLIEDQPHEVVMAAWRRSLAAVVPSVWVEAFGMVALEAMTQGRPVIASRSGGLAEVVVDGETGILVEPGDVATLRDAMQALMADPDRCRELGLAGRVRAQRYRAIKVVPRLVQLYEREMANLSSPAG